MRNLYSNLVASAADFANITPVISDLTNIEFLGPCSEHRGKDLDQPSIDTSGIVFCPISPVIRLP